MSEEKLDQIYTADEAAARLRLSNRALIKIARKSGHCSRVGRDYLFSEADLLAIWQDMREPAAAPRMLKHNVPLPSPLAIEEDLRWMFGPPVRVDRRVIRVLECIDRQKEPKTYLDIKDCGARTIEELLEKGLVRSCGVNSIGQTKVVITPLGKDEVRTYERWKRKRKAREERRS
jgi:hypothetical protein